MSTRRRSIPGWLLALIGAAAILAVVSVTGLVFQEQIRRFLGPAPGLDGTDVATTLTPPSTPSVAVAAPTLLPPPPPATPTTPPTATAVRAASPSPVARAASPATQPVVPAKPVSSPPAAGAPATARGHRWKVRVYNVDDEGTAYVNTTRAVTVNTWGGDSGQVNIDALMIDGENMIRFTTFNRASGYAWGFQLIRDDVVVWEDAAGRIVPVGAVGANNNDQTSTNRMVFDLTITIRQDGQISVRTSPR